MKLALELQTLPTSTLQIEQSLSTRVIMLIGTLNSGLNGTRQCPSTIQLTHDLVGQVEKLQHFKEHLLDFTKVMPEHRDTTMEEWITT